MKVYEQEKNFVSQLAVTNATASILMPIKIADENEDLFIDNLEGIAKNGCDNKDIQRSLARIATFEHPDLMYGSAILVSTVMNKNDDVFLPEETWSARYTAVNIPYNDDHVATDIIGHTIAVRPLDSEGKVIESQKPPDYFDLEVDFVMYRGIFPSIAKEIMEKAPLGEKFVSMEAKFQDFDYGLVDSQNKIKIVARNKETAFLTKYLRAYGGEGKYQDYRIGRVLRDLRFSGVGNVDDPANPGSEYTKFDDLELVSQSNLIEDRTVVLYVTKGNIMKIETLEDAQKVIAELTDKLSKYEGKEAEAMTNKVATLENEKKTIAEELEAEKGKVTVATQQLEDLNKKVGELNTKIESLTADRDAKAQELDGIKKEAKANERVSQLKELGLEVNEEKRKEIADWSDSTFASVIEFTKSVKPADKGQENDGGTNSAKASQTLENAEPDKKGDVTETSGDDASEGEKIHKTAAKLVEKLRSGRNKGPKSSKKD